LQTGKGLWNGKKTGGDGPWVVSRAQGNWQRECGGKGVSFDLRTVGRERRGRFLAKKKGTDRLVRKRGNSHWGKIQSRKVGKRG